MATYVMLTRVDPARLTGRGSYLELYQRVRDTLHREAPDVHWQGSWSVLGPYDYVDVLEAPDNDAVTRVASILRADAGAQVEVWPATEWSRFKTMVSTNGHRPRHDLVTEAGEESFPASDPPSWT